MRVLFLTDSLSLPSVREEETVYYEDTYLAQLRLKFPNDLIIDSAIGGATVQDLLKQVFYYKAFKPDIVIIHSGIVDCAPRAFRNLEKKILSKLGLINKIKKITFLLRKYRGYKLTKPKDFEKTLKKIKSSFENTPVYAIGILKASQAYEDKVPGIGNSVIYYNSILKKHMLYIDTAGVSFDEIMKDHHHLNKKGHAHMFNITSKMLTTLKQ